MIPDLLCERGIELCRRRCACPLHGGTNRQAFAVSPDGQRWRCFAGCGGGDVVDLVRRLDGVGFKTAVDRLGGGAVLDLAAYRRRRAEAQAREKARRQAVWRESDLADELCQLDDAIDLAAEALGLARTRRFRELAVHIAETYERLIVQRDDCLWELEG